MLSVLFKQITSYSLKKMRLHVCTKYVLRIKFASFDSNCISFICFVVVIKETKIPHTLPTIVVAGSDPKFVHLFFVWF